MSTHTDLVKRLEHFGRDVRNSVLTRTCQEAATALTEANARAERLEAALKPFVEGASHTRVFLTTREKMHQTGIEIFDEDVNDARAALASRETKEKPNA